MRRTGVGVLAALGAAAALMLATNGAGAAGPCVPGTSPARACPITSSVSGETTANVFNRYEYFRFWAQRGTRIRFTVTDEEDPACSTPGNGGPCTTTCGYFTRAAEIGQFACSTPADGRTRSAHFRGTTTHAGVWDLLLRSGRIVGDAPVPYTLALAATPHVWWPPPCVVPSLSSGTGLRAAEVQLRHDRCRVGRIRRQRVTTASPGTVLRLSPGGGALRPKGTRIGVTVAS